MYEAAVRAYQDAGVHPRDDIDSFVTVAEDFHEGTSIFDEYVPDQLGAMLRPVHTIAGEGIQGLLAGYMQVRTGTMDIVAVEGHSKASNILNLAAVQAYAMEPVLVRPLGAHPIFIAGMEMARYLYETGNTSEQCARVVQKNKANALRVPYAGFGGEIDLDEIEASPPVAEPLRRHEVSPHADGAVVVVLASEDAAKGLSGTPVWIRGAGWANGSYALEHRSWADAEYARAAGEMAYREAGIRNPREEIDLAEVDDTYAYKELQHMEALRLCGIGEAGPLTEEGFTAIDGELPVNPSGGSLGVGHLLDASGLHRVLEIVLQLRGQAEGRQIQDAETGLAFGWRGLPSASGAAVVLSNAGQ